MIEIDEIVFNEFVAYSENRDYSGGQLPACARYAFSLFSYEKMLNFVGPMPQKVYDFT